MINFQTQERGAAMLIFIVFFLMASLGVTSSISYGIYKDQNALRLMFDSKQSYLTADSAIEDMAYRYIAGKTPGAIEVITLGGVRATSTITYSNTELAYMIVSEANDNRAYRSSAMKLFVGSGASFNFGVQAGNGGFELTNGSSVRGNVFANGYIKKTGGGTATIYGDVISAGPTGLIENVNATSSAWAHTVKNSNIGKNVYAYTLNGGVTTGGAKYYNKINGAIVNGAPEVSGVVVGDEATTTMPISDADIDAMKQNIIDTGTRITATSTKCSTGTYEISSSMSLGNVRIGCNFQLKKQGAGTTLTLTGPIWVEGNTTFKSGPRLVISNAVGNRTVPIIADKVSNRATSSKIIVENGTTFLGTGGSMSYILLISQNNDAEKGGTNNADALSLSQSSSGDLLTYASHGRVTLANSISLNEITGYKIVLGNSASITYKSGLANLLFTSGPGGGFTIGSWKESQ